MKGKQLIQTVAVSKANKSVRPILVKDDPNHPLLSTYRDLESFFTGNIRLALPKPAEGRSWKEVKRIEFYSPVEGEISEINEFEFQQKVKPELDDLIESFEDPDNLDPSDPGDREKLYLLEVFELPEDDLHSYFVKVDSVYILSNWGLENAPQLEGLPKPSVSDRQNVLTVDIIKSSGNDSFIFKANPSDEDISSYLWDIAGQKVEKSEIKESDLDLDKLPESFKINLEVKSFSGEIANDSITASKANIKSQQEQDTIGPSYPGFNTDGDKLSDPPEGESEDQFEEEQQENEIIAWLKEHWKKLLLGLLAFIVLIFLLNECNNSSNSTVTNDAPTEQEITEDSDSKTADQSGPTNNPSSEGAGDQQARQGDNPPGSSGGAQEKSGGAPSPKKQEPLVQQRSPEIKKKENNLPDSLKNKPLGGPGMEKVGIIYRMESEDGFLYWLEANGERYLLNSLPSEIPQNDRFDQNQDFKQLNSF